MDIKERVLNKCSIDDMKGSTKNNLSKLFDVIDNIHSDGDELMIYTHRSEGCCFIGARVNFSVMVIPMEEIDILNWLAKKTFQANTRVVLSTSYLVWMDDDNVNIPNMLHFYSNIDSKRVDARVWGFDTCGLTRMQEIFECMYTPSNETLQFNYVAFSMKKLAESGHGLFTAINDWVKRTSTTRLVDYENKYIRDLPDGHALNFLVKSLPAINIPIEEREIPLKSMVKNAAKATR